LDTFPIINIGPGIFKDPSLLGTYHGAPPLLNSSISAQVYVVSSNGTDVEYNTPLIESSPPNEVPSFGEILRQEFPENTTAPLTPYFFPLQGKILVWERVPQSITQIPVFYPPPRFQAFQVDATLTLPNMVLSIPIWYLHPPSMVPTPSLPPQIDGLPMHIPIQDPPTPPPPPTSSNTTAIKCRRI
jgi:hypothetical protein